MDNILKGYSPKITFSVACRKVHKIKLRVTSCELRSLLSVELRVTSYELGVSSWVLKKTMESE